MTAEDEWSELCQEYAMWHKLELAVFAAVRVAFYNGSDGTGEKPSTAELDDWDQAREKLANIESRMDALIEKTFGKGVRKVVEPAALLHPCSCRPLPFVTWSDVG